MTTRDLVEIAFGNLRRHRLRVFFTVAGVVIAIATFVALLSFAAGSQKWISEGFEELGLLTSMNVYPREPDAAGADSTAAAPLDAAAVGTLGSLPGVRYAFPFVDFSITAEVLDTTLTAQARALPPEAFSTGVFQRVFGGLSFSDPAAREAIVTHGFMESLGVADPDSLVGRTMIISMQVASLDSALLNVVGEEGEIVLERFRELDLGDLRDPLRRADLMHRELNDGVQRFVEGFFNHQLTVTDTLTIRGVGAHLERYNVPMAPVIVPVATARRLSGAGFSLSNDPASLLDALRGGSLFAPAGAESSLTYPRVTLNLESLADHGAVKDTVEALGFRAFSYAEQFEEIQRFHLYFYAGLGVVGFLALITAALGILNTLVMSVNERRKEIVVVKSLGAHEGDIRRLFLVESAVIGAMGSVLGIVVGWLGTVVVGAVMQTIMSREDMPSYEPFAFPLWLILLALAFGVGVSVLAGTFPAARAAQVDPVEALRGE